MAYVGKKVQYLDLDGKVKESMLCSTGKARPWLSEVACWPYADTVLVNLTHNNL